MRGPAFHTRRRTGCDMSRQNFTEQAYHHHITNGLPELEGGNAASELVPAKWEIGAHAR